MGHKVNPISLRLGIIKDWKSHWYAGKKGYVQLLHEDLAIRSTIQTRHAEGDIALVEIERSPSEVTVTVHAAKPGIVIGRGGQRVDELRRGLEKLTSKKVRLNIHEIREPELEAALVARNVAQQLERRVAYRRAMKQAIQRTTQRGAKGIKIVCAGRLGGSEMSRRVKEMSGRVPLHTLCADIDYGFQEAHTTLGRIGVKVWIYRGDIIKPQKIEGTAEAKTAETPAAQAGQAPAEAVPDKKVSDATTQAS